jgi:hypothetical protein
MILHSKKLKAPKDKKESNKMPKKKKKTPAERGPTIAEID